MSGTKSDAEWFGERVPHARRRRPSHDLSDAEWFGQATGAASPSDHAPAPPAAHDDADPEPRAQGEPTEQGDA